jgi:magnesium transporter
VIAKAALVGTLAREFRRRHPDEAAHALEERPAGDVLQLFETDPGAAPLLGQLALDVATSVLEGLSDDAARRTLLATDVVRTATLLARLESVRRDALLALLDKRAADELRELLHYPPDSAGALMDPRVTVFRVGTTVEAALKRLRRLQQRELGSIYIVDRDERLVGAVPLGELAIARPEQRLDQLAPDVPASANAFATREEIVEFLAQRRLASLPVVNAENRLIGVIRNQTLMAATEREASADIATMVGVSKEERALSSAPMAVRRRLPWLQINLATSFLAAFVVGQFEGTIERLTALAVLMPIVAGQSGNTGMQALAVTLRSIALREVRMQHWPRIFIKELFAGLTNGLAVAATTVVAVLLWSRSVPLAMVIGVAMVISMTIAGVAGASVPMILKALGRDPAQSSSIVLTTVTDVGGFLSFLGLATLFANLLESAAR